MKIFYIILISIVLSGNFIEPNFIQKKNKLVTVSYSKHAPIIDGVMDKFIWEDVNPISDFLQEDPIPMSDPSALTEVRVLYDEKNIYIHKLAIAFNLC